MKICTKKITDQKISELDRLLDDINDSNLHKEMTK